MHREDWLYNVSRLLPNCSKISTVARVDRILVRSEHLSAEIVLSGHDFLLFRGVVVVVVVVDLVIVVILVLFDSKAIHALLKLVHLPLHSGYLVLLLHLRVHESHNSSGLAFLSRDWKASEEAVAIGHVAVKHEPVLVSVNDWLDVVLGKDEMVWRNRRENEDHPVYVSTFLLFNEIGSIADARVARLAVGRQTAHNLNKNLAENFLARDAGDLFLRSGLARMKTPVDLVLDSEKPLFGAEGVFQGWNIVLIPFQSLPQPFLVRHVGLGFLQGD